MRTSVKFTEQQVKTALQSDTILHREPIKAELDGLFWGGWIVAAPRADRGKAFWYAPHIYFLFKVFDKRAPSVIVYPVLFLTAINSFYLYFASQTYNEAMYVFLQAMVFFAFIKLQQALDTHGADLKKTFLPWIFMGLTVVLLALAKHIGITVIPALVVYFLFQKQYRFAIYSVLSFLVVKIPQEIFKSLAWGDQTQYGQQGSMLLQVDPYDASKGQEDISGFIDRFTGNAQLFLSKRFFQIIGFMEEQSRTIHAGLTMMVILLLLFGLYRIILSKNRLMLFTALYTAGSLVATFIVLQTRWDQPRYIMIYVPFMLMIIFYGIYSAVKKSSVGQNVLLVCILIVTGSVFVSTIKRSGENSKSLRKNLKGDIYYGYTPDWVNYLRMSEWVGENLPDSAYVACRKAPISFIYANGKKFYPIYRVQADQADSVLTLFRERKVTHVLLANLRRDPNKAFKGNIITTVHVMLKAVADKYPERLKLIHQEGQIEPAYLYEIDTREK